MLSKIYIFATTCLFFPLLQASATDLQINCIDNEFVQKELTKTVCERKYGFFDGARMDRVKRNAEYYCQQEMQKSDSNILADTENHKAGDKIKFIDPKCELISVVENEKALEKMHNQDNYKCFDLKFKASVIVNHSPGSGSVNEMKTIQLDAAEKRTGETVFWGPSTLTSDEALKYAEQECETAGGKASDLKAYVVATTALIHGQPVWQAKGTCTGTFYSFKLDYRHIQELCQKSEEADPNVMKTFVPDRCLYLSEDQTTGTPMIFHGPAYLVNVRAQRSIDYAKIPSLFEKWKEDRLASCQKSAN